VETIALCNAACSFCPYATLERKGTRMSDALVEKIIDDLTGIPHRRSFLRDLSTEEVKAYLARFKGVGSKMIACVLLFGMGRPAFPVDTHVFRVTRRLGLLNGRFTPEKAQEFLESRILPGDRYALHVQLVQHGRQVCKAQRPLCASCVLARVCAHVRK